MHLPSLPLLLAGIILTAVTGAAAHHALAQTPPQTAVPAATSPSSQLATQSSAALPAPLGWGSPTRGLRCRWMPPPEAYPAGSLATIRMQVQNISDQPAFWECRGGRTWCVGYLGSKADKGGILPEFSVDLGKGARLAMYREVQREPGFGVHPQSRGPFGPNDPVPAWYRLDSGATMTLVWEYPYVLAAEGTATIDSILNRADPGGGRKERLDLDTLRCAPLQLRITAGDPDAKHAYDVAWGAASDGLQAGLYYEYGRRPVALGKLAAIGVRIRNTGARAVQVTCSQTAYRDDPPELKDAAGQRLTVQVPRGETYPQMTCEIQPGQALGLDNASFTVLPKGADPAQARGPVLVADPGRYNVVKTFRYNTDGGKELSKQLTAGPLEVEVVAKHRPPETAPASRPPATTPAP